jgi:hypothetical protein
MADATWWTSLVGVATGGALTIASALVNDWRKGKREAKQRAEEGMFKLEDEQRSIESESRRQAALQTERYKCESGDLLRILMRSSGSMNRDQLRGCLEELGDWSKKHPQWAWNKSLGVFVGMLPHFEMLCDSTDADFEKAKEEFKEFYRKIDLRTGFDPIDNEEKAAFG